MALYTVGAWWVLVAWIGHAAVYSLLEKKEEDIESSAPEISKGLGKRVVGRGGGKEAKGKRWGSGREVFLFFLTSQMMTSRGEYHLRRQFWSQKTLVQSWSYLRSHDQHTSWDSHLTAPRVNYPREEVLPQGTPARLGREGNSPSDSCQWCLGSWHPLPPCCVFTQLQKPGQPSKGGRRKQRRN